MGERKIIRLKNKFWNVSEVCEFYSISPTTINTWCKDGFPKTKFNQYPIVESFRWYKQNILGKLLPDKNSLAAEKLRRERAKADLEEIKVKKETEQIIYFSDIEVWLNSLVLELRQGLLNIPRRLADTLAAIQDPKRIEYELREEIYKLLRAYTDEAYKRINQKKSNSMGGEEEWKRKNSSQSLIGSGNFSNRQNPGNKKRARRND